MINKLVLSLKQRLSELPENRKTRLRQLGNIAMNLVPHRHNLVMLSLKHGGDKITHGYIPHYQDAFQAIRKKKLTVLEIGIGGFDDPYAGGESLRMWRDFFPNSMIYGIDITDKRGLDEKRIKTLIGDQSDPEFLENVIRQTGPLDIIIDDGSHYNPHILASFEFLFPHLADNGIYIIEDLYTSYWGIMGGDWRQGAEKDTSMSLLKSLADGINYRYIPFREPTGLDRSVVSVQFFRKIAFIYKGNNVQEDPPHVLHDLEKEESRLSQHDNTGSA